MAHHNHGDYSKHLKLRATLDNLWEDDEVEGEGERSTSVLYPRNEDNSADAAAATSKRTLDNLVLSQRDAFLSGYLGPEEDKLQSVKFLNDQKTRGAYFNAYSDVGDAEFDAFDNPYDFYSPHAWRADVERMKRAMRLQQPQNVHPNDVRSLEELDERLASDDVLLDFRGGRRRMESRQRRTEALRQRQTQQLEEEEREEQDLLHPQGEVARHRVPHVAHEAPCSFFVHQRLSNDQVPSFMRQRDAEQEALQREVAEERSGNHQHQHQQEEDFSSWLDDEETARRVRTAERAVDSSHDPNTQRYVAGLVAPHTVYDAGKYIQERNRGEDDEGKQSEEETLAVGAAAAAQRRIDTRQQVRNVRASTLGLSVAFDVATAHR